MCSLMKVLWLYLQGLCCQVCQQVTNISLFLFCDHSIMAVPNEKNWCGFSALFQHANTNAHIASTRDYKTGCICTNPSKP